MKKLLMIALMSTLAAPQCMSMEKQANDCTSPDAITVLGLTTNTTYDTCSRDEDTFNQIRLPECLATIPGAASSTGTTQPAPVSAASSTGTTQSAISVPTVTPLSPAGPSSGAAASSNPIMSPHVGHRVVNFYSPNDVKRVELDITTDIDSVRENAYLHVDGRKIAIPDLIFVNFNWSQDSRFFIYTNSSFEVYIVDTEDTEDFDKVYGTLAQCPLCTLADNISGYLWSDGSLKLSFRHGGGSAMYQVIHTHEHGWSLQKIQEER